MVDHNSGEDQWYVIATGPATEEPARVLKHGDTFGVFDRHGDIFQAEGDGHGNLTQQGLYHEGTRYLSYWELRVNGQRPLLLSSMIKEDNSLLVVDMTTPDMYRQGELVIPKGSVHLFRSVALWGQARYEHLRLVNYGEQPVELTVELLMAADYRDIFEVRGVRRPQRGTLLASEVGENYVVLGYRGLDRETRQTRICFDWQPHGLDTSRAVTMLHLESRESRHMHLSAVCTAGRKAAPVCDYYQAMTNVEATIAAHDAQAAKIYTSNEEFNDWLNRSGSDLEMLVTHTPEGMYPYAGVPWYSTPFGRDGLITALQTLWMRPALARGVLTFLAATQADRLDPAQDAEPGKILHEARSGEMATLGEIPFGRYYGTVDATPLFVILAGHYYRRTSDRDFIRTIWPNIERALAWIDNYGDSDGDGFVEYARHSENGLVQQGWKDSNDSVFHADGTLAHGPIALCEVQGYVYKAKLLAAELGDALSRPDQAQRWRHDAERLRRRFNEAFWVEELGTYALALDGDKRPCKVRASNAGHTLFSGIADPAYARRVTDTLMAKESFSGWGVRTVAESESRYNPMAYHNGSIWPHDNGMVAFGMARYGFKQEAMAVLTGFFESSIFLELHRLPELFCGFTRMPGQGPTLYPVACSPQAWASSAVFQMVQACLGLTFSVDKPQVRFYHPQLPAYIDWMRIEGLCFGDGLIDLVLRRHANDVGINVERKEGDIDVAIVV
ncbi:amylo-alpha-1,6-glucosidase [Methylomagnum sp.]